MIMESLAENDELRIVTEQLTGEIASLREANARLANEKTVLAKRNSDLKVANKQALDAKSASVTQLQTMLHELKSRECFPTADELRRSFSDIEAIRTTVAENVSKLGDLFDSDGNLSKLKNAKEVLSELRQENTTTRQANDLLRDKLTDFSSQLAEVQSRNRDLEHTLGVKEAAHQRALDDLHTANALAAEQTAKMQQLHADHADALVARVQAEGNISKHERQIIELKEELELGKEALAALDVLQREVVELRTRLQEKEINMLSQAAMVSMKDEIIASMSASGQDQSDTMTLRTTLTEKTSLLDTCLSRCDDLEAQLKASKLAESRHMDESRKYLLLNKELNSENSMRIEHVKTLERSAEQLRDELRVFQQAQLRSQVVQQRFEDQATTLKLLQEAHGDLQERLMAAEKSHAAALEDEASKRAHVEGLSQGLKHALSDAKVENKRYQDLLASARAEREEALDSERQRSEEALSSERQRSEEALKYEHQCSEEKVLAASEARVHAQQEAEIIRARVANIEADLKHTVSELQDTMLSLAAARAEMIEMRGRADDAEAENARLFEQRQTLLARYRDGVLCDDEKVFVDRLLEENQTACDRRVAEKQNELRRNTNIISHLEVKISHLEKALAKARKTENEEPEPDARSPQVREPLPPIPKKQSIVDVTKLAPPFPGTESSSRIVKPPPSPPQPPQRVELGQSASTDSEPPSGSRAGHNKPELGKRVRGAADIDTKNQGESSDSGRPRTRQRSVGKKAARRGNGNTKKQQQEGNAAGSSGAAASRRRIR
ncbi:hypothetical protein K488DRAFT_67427 [Vararia minispora EC-137]|uniref:Uncharacterized protein n=1 Tax=Vararia minispora EC-137 TaxID=1314806 RepID=A0ACB8QYU0_9AGAM|nr:hypothetical protein K488DRAFT_67427 [Vararia minispora EC-137]